MLLQAKQIEANGLSAFVLSALSGAGLSGMLSEYFVHSGWVGPNVVYASGGDQLINGAKTFLNPITIPGTGSTGSAMPFGAVLNAISGSLLSYSGFAASAYAVINGTNVFLGSNSFAQPLTVARPTLTGHAATLYDVTYVSGVLVSGMQSASLVGVVYITGTQTINDNKTFNGVTSVAIPTTASGAVPFILLSGLSGLLNSGYSPVFTGLLVGQAMTRFAGYAAALCAIQFAGSSITNGAGFSASRFAASPGGVTVIYNKSRSTIIGGHGGAVPSDLLFDEDIASSDGSSYVRAHRRYVTSTNFITGGTGASTINYTAINSGGEVTVFVMSTVQNQSVPPLQVAQPTNSQHATRVQDLTSASGALLTATAMSFYFDPYTLASGTNLVEGFVNAAFFITGVSLGCQNTGSSAALTGSIYRRDTSNTKTTLFPFSLGSSAVFAMNTGLSIQVQSMDRIGIDIINYGNLLTGLSIGIFGQ